MSDSVRPHKRQPTRLHHPWDSPCKNTGVGCHFLLQCMKVKSESEVTQSCPTLCNPIDGSPPGSSVYGVFQARILEWRTIAFSFRVVEAWIIIQLVFFLRAKHCTKQFISPVWFNLTNTQWSYFCHFVDEETRAEKKLTKFSYVT